MITKHREYKVYLGKSKVITLTSIVIAKNSNLSDFLKNVKETDQVVHIGKS